MWYANFVVDERLAYGLVLGNEDGSFKLARIMDDGALSLDSAVYNMSVRCITVNFEPNQYEKKNYRNASAWPQFVEGQCECKVGCP